MTLALAILGVVLSIASIAWQAWTFFASGPRVTVTAQNALPMFNGRPGDWTVHVTATNSGRAPCTITSWGIDLPDGSSAVSTSPLAWTPPCPYRLEPHAAVDFPMLADEVRRIHAERGVKFDDMRPFVNVSGKGRIRAKAGVPLT